MGCGDSGGPQKWTGDCEDCLRTGVGANFMVRPKRKKAEKEGNPGGTDGAQKGADSRGIPLRQQEQCEV